MELLFAILLCLFFLMVYIIGQMYFEMDKEKSRAINFVNKMIEPLDEWVTHTVELAGSPVASPKLADALQTMAENYFNCEKNKLKKIPLVNSMAELSEPLAAAAAGTEAGLILKARADAAAGLGMLRIGYNQSVRMLNGYLMKRGSAAVGKLFGMSSLEKLCDLS